MNLFCTDCALENAGTPVRKKKKKKEKKKKKRALRRTLKSLFLVLYFLLLFFRFLFLSFVFFWGGLFVLFCFWFVCFFSFFLIQVSLGNLEKPDVPLFPPTSTSKSFKQFSTVVKPNQRNFSDQSKRTQISLWSNQNSKELHVANTKRGKTPATISRYALVLVLLLIGRESGEIFFFFKPIT